MNKSVLKLCLILTVVLGLATQVNASLQLTVGDALYLGNIDNGAPADPDDEVGYINILRTLPVGQTDIQIPAGTGELYDRVGSTLAGPFPTAVESGAIHGTLGSNQPNGFNKIDLGALSFLYILAKDGNAGSFVWYNAAGFTGEIEVPQDLNGPAQAGGLSHVSFYDGTTVIPEPATLFVWGGLGAMALSIARRRTTRG
jgi:hypothetical protein